jgi:hypothetical protein
MAAVLTLIFFEDYSAANVAEPNATTRSLAAHAINGQVRPITRAVLNVRAS